MPQKIYSAYDGERRYPAMKGEETGMVWCPQRLSSIATMRCAEYQKQFGCGFGCASKATQGQIAAVKMSAGNMQEACAGPRICPSCRGPKSHLAKVCIKCRGAVGGARGRYRKRGAGIFIRLRERVEAASAESLGPHRT